MSIPALLLRVASSDQPGQFVRGVPRVTRATQSRASSAALRVQAASLLALGFRTRRRTAGTRVPSSSTVLTRSLELAVALVFELEVALVGCERVQVVRGQLFVHASELFVDGR